MKNIINSGWNVIRIKNANLIFVQPLFIYLFNRFTKQLHERPSICFSFSFENPDGVWKQLNKTESKHENSRLEVFCK